MAQTAKQATDAEVQQAYSEQSSQEGQTVVSPSRVAAHLDGVAEVTTSDATGVTKVKTDASIIDVRKLRRKYGWTVGSIITGTTYLEPVSA